MTGMVGNTGQALDHQRHARQGPQRRREAMRRGPGAQRPFDPRQIVGPQTRLAPRAARGLQPLPTVGAPSLMPVIHGGRGDTQLPRHRRLRSAAREQLRGLKPACFQCSKIPTGSAIGSRHESA